MISMFKHVNIFSISTVVPANEISLLDELEYYDNDRGRVDRTIKMIGFDKRRVAPEGVTASDLCIQAAERLLTNHSIDRSSIDGIIFVTQSPDYQIPATALIQQHLLGLSKNCAAFDINLGCSGYIYGLWIAAGLIESRAASRILLMVGDALKQVHADPTNRIMAPVWGDVGTASLIEYCETEKPMTIALGSDGSGYETLITPGGGARIPNLIDGRKDAGNFYEPNTDHNGFDWRVGGLANLWMNSMAVFKFTLDVLPPHLKMHLAETGFTPDDIDCVVVHQANKQIVQNVAEKAGFPLEKAPWETVSKYGNLSSASLPTVLCDIFSQSEPHQENKRLMLSGFGAGLSWASCIFDLKGTSCLGVSDFLLPEHVPSRDELIDYWCEKFIKSGGRRVRSV